MRPPEPRGRSGGVGLRLGPSLSDGVLSPGLEGLALHVPSWASRALRPLLSGAARRGPPPAPSRPASIRDRMARAGHRALVLAGKSRRGASSDAALRLGGGEAAVHAGPHRPTGQNATANSPRGTGDFR